MNNTMNNNDSNNTTARDNGIERIVVALYADEVDRTFDVTRTSIVQVDGPACNLSEEDKDYIWSIYQHCVEVYEMSYTAE